MLLGSPARPGPEDLITSAGEPISHGHPWAFHLQPRTTQQKHVLEQQKQQKQETNQRVFRHNKLHKIQAFPSLKQMLESWTGGLKLKNKLSDHCCLRILMSFLSDKVLIIPQPRREAALMIASQSDSHGKHIWLVVGPL